jgi:glycogen synthase
MRLLFLSNFYPPASRGGYEEWCQEITNGLQDRGHDVRVMTSRMGYRKTDPPDQPWVQRSLHLEMQFATFQNAILFFTHRKRYERENHDQIQDFVKDFQPDAVMIWGMWNLHRSIPVLVEQLVPDRVVYYMGDYWPTLPSQFENYWSAPARNVVSALPKAFLKPFAQKLMDLERGVAPQLKYVIFPSNFMREEFEHQGIFPQISKVVYGGVDTRLYRELCTPQRQNDTISLLYVGRLTYEKGTHTAIQAVSHLIRHEGIKNVHLTIVGHGNADYLRKLHELVDLEALDSFVSFIPAQPKEAMPCFYGQADIFLFTSIWGEPFGRVLVEAMASGLPVVGTCVGGAAELLIESQNALTFTPDDHFDLAQQLKKLMESPALRQKLGVKGREIAVSRFDLHRMTTEIEASMQALAH